MASPFRMLFFQPLSVVRAEIVVFFKDHPTEIHVFLDLFGFLLTRWSCWWLINGKLYIFFIWHRFVILLVFLRDYYIYLFLLGFKQSFLRIRVFIFGRGLFRSGFLFLVRVILEFFLGGRFIRWKDFFLFFLHGILDHLVDLSFRFIRIEIFELILHLGSKFLLIKWGIIFLRGLDHKEAKSRLILCQIKDIQCFLKGKTIQILNYFKSANMR